MNTSPNTSPNTLSGPVFIGGLDRSGKTPLRLMLSCHPNLSLSRRTYMWTSFYNHFGNLSRASNFERCLAAMMRHGPIRRLEPDVELIRREFWRGKKSYARLFALFHEQYAQRVGKPRWGDQLAFIERYAEPIFDAYPEARIIHMVRHPRQRFENLAAGTTYRTGKVGWEIARWIFSVRLGLRNQQRYPDQYRILKYETLMGRREETLCEICDFIGEDFLPAMLTLEGAMRFREDGKDGSSDEWGTKNGKSTLPRLMSEQEIVFLRSYAMKEMQALGYSEDPIRLSSQETLKLCTVDGPANVIGAMLWNAIKNE